MKLNWIRIKNFCSVKDIKIEFDPTCRILVGINESGKSNILRALSFLNEESQSDSNDIREALPDDDEVITESYILFDFKLEENESTHLIESVLAKILTNETNPDIVSINGKNEKIRKFCMTQNKGCYHVNILTQEKLPNYYAFKRHWKLVEGWKKPTNLCPEDYVIELNDGKEYKLARYKLVQATNSSDSIPDEYLKDAEIKDFAQLYGQAVREIIRKNLPDVLFWEYNEANFLPDSVSIEAFLQNPDSCAPLRNMFTLAQINNITESLGHARDRTPNQFQNYLSRIASKTTEHFRKVWKEYQNIEFSLNLNADLIVPGIKEENTYDFTQRSDGFKRFVTFLLMVSANVETNRIRNALLIIDEPETSLHPSGARYLRDELINISKKNYVVYSTHSIFMIDQGDIKRHYIVKKKNEITHVEPAKESNITDEEVLYNALGYSVFSVLKKNILIFEGWNDKHLFQTALENTSAKLKQKFNDVRVCHAKGVSTVRSITPMIELANRTCLVVSDSDATARKQKKEYERSRGFGSWKTYQEIDSSIDAVTGEDFIRNDFIAEQVRTSLHGSETPDFDETVLPPKKDKLSEIERWLKSSCAMNGQEAKNKITEIKNLIFENLTPTNVEYEEYEKLLKGILTAIDSN